MPTDPRVLELVEEALGSSRTPEQVCDRPELLGSIRERWERCRSVELQLQKLFPSSDPADSTSAGSSSPSNLLVIPGYEIGSILGRGGVGVVHQARHLRLKRTVAVKTLLAGGAASGTERARFLREAQAVASLVHNNIVQIYDVGESDGIPFFTMEFVNGGTLADSLAGVPQSAVSAAEKMLTLSDAIAVAHRNGIVHRDLKPANVLVTAEGTLKVTDFGLAYCAESPELLTLCGMRAGTPSYMAPEQAAGLAGANAPGVDLYALGAILYEMLTGRPPFKGESVAHTHRHLLEEEVVRPSQLNATVPRDLETICLKCLQKNPARRYPTAIALADDIRRFQNGEPILARRTPVYERALKWRRRHPAAALVLAGTLTAVVATIVGVCWLISTRATTAKASELDLQESIAAQQQGKWVQASVALDRANFRIGNHASKDLRRRLDQARSDLTLVSRLDAIRLNVFSTDAGTFPRAQADKDYVAAFMADGFDTSALNPARFATQVQNSNIRVTLISALDEWFFCSPDAPRRIWLNQAARLADTGSTDWRKEFRAQESWTQPALIKKLAASAPFKEESVAILIRFSVYLAGTDADTIPFLIEMQRAHPDDFWANLYLANAFHTARNWDEAIRYYQAAISLRPRTAVVHNNLGSTLAKAGRTNDALLEFREAILTDPDDPVLHDIVGRILLNTGHRDEARQEFAAAARLDAKDPEVYLELGLEASKAGKYAEGEVFYRRALTLDPKNNYAQKLLAAALKHQNQQPTISPARTAVNPPCAHGLGSLPRRDHPPEALHRLKMSI